MIDHFVLFLQPKPKTIILVCDHFTLCFFAAKTKNDHFEFSLAEKHNMVTQWKTATYSVAGDLRQQEMEHK